MVPSIMESYSGPEAAQTCLTVGMMFFYEMLMQTFQNSGRHETNLCVLLVNSGLYLEILP